MLAAELCFGHGTADAVDEAAYLLAYALHFSPRLPDGFLDARLTAAEKRAVDALLRRRIDERLPAPYLTGEAWFAGLRFHVDPRVLIPRSPIAELVEHGFAPWLPEPPRRVLDLCTGSGCIAIAAAVHLGCEVDAVDISPESLAVARRNVAAHGVEGQVRLVEADLFTGLAPAAYDLIVTNPPYVGEAEWSALPPEFRAEPALALRSGQDGLDLPLRILADARGHLAPAGLLVLEVGASAPALRALLPDDAPLSWIDFEHGGEGVCCVEAKGLAVLEPILRARLADRAGHVV